MFPPIEPFGPPSDDQLHNTLSRTRKLRWRRRVAAGGAAAAVVVAVAVPLALSGGSGKPASVQVAGVPNTTAPKVTPTTPATTVAPTTAPPTTAVAPPPTAPAVSTTTAPPTTAPPTAPPSTVWTARTVPAAVTGSILNVTCPTASDCYALGNDRQGTHASILASTDAGATWKIVDEPASSVDSVSCATSSTCIAVGYVTSGVRLSPAALITRDGGASWATVTLPSDLRTVEGAFHAVNCPTTSVCLLAGEQDASPFKALVLRSADGGRSWTEVKAPSEMAIADAVSCADTTCVLGGPTSGPTATSMGLASVSTDLGRTWGPAVPAGTVSLDVVSCAGQNCVGVDGTDGTDSYGLGEVVVSHDGGRSWTGHPSSTVTGSSVSCTPEFCLLVGATYHESSDSFSSTAYLSHDAGRTWTPVNPPESDGLSSVSCPTSTLCVAGGGAATPGLFTFKP